MKGITIQSRLARCLKTSVPRDCKAWTRRIFHGLACLGSEVGNSICFFKTKIVGNNNQDSRQLSRAKQYNSLKVCVVGVVDQDTESSPVVNNMLRRLKRFADTDPRDLPGLEDDSSLKSIEHQESRDPNVTVITTEGAAPVYRSRKPQVELSGLPVLADFGQMRLAEGTINQDRWMSDLYRTPEVLLGLPGGYPVDVWSIGVMTLELMEGKNLFDPIDRVNNNQYVLPLALTQYIGYLGSPPLDMIRKSPLFSSYFDEQGNWASDPPIPKTSFKDFVTTIPPGEEKDQFLRFIRKILV
ncbi:hypothetical protein AJ79_03882 [Helicocarpus griseus UAMH5409]|uniref:Protein kinase domain-containing protein n=1 Tax=Helicocarpus griseus UAMH5409 TaxID=1447875 RepID=A0A2B7XVR4_9EURO|nr:hypothetical protein AJ79_03882 [Helicocarpus griseus UAMH5409]